MWNWITEACPCCHTCAHKNTYKVYEKSKHTLHCIVPVIQLTCDLGLNWPARGPRSRANLPCSSCSAPFDTNHPWHATLHAHSSLSSLVHFLLLWMFDPSSSSSHRFWLASPDIHHCSHLHLFRLSSICFLLSLQTLCQHHSPQTRVHHHTQQRCVQSWPYLELLLHITVQVHDLHYPHMFSTTGYFIQNHRSFLGPHYMISLAQLVYLAIKTYQ